MTRPLVIVGCGGFGVEILTLIINRSQSAFRLNGELAQENFKVVGFYDDGEPRIQDASKIAGMEMQCFTDLKTIPSDACFIVAVGEPIQRHKLFQRFIAAKLTPVTLIHNSAVISNTAVIGEGCVLCPYVFVGPFAEIGSNALLNNYASVAHDARIGSSSVLHPYATLSGFASCGIYSLLATRATILVSVSMGAYCKLSAGSTLTTDTKDGSLAVGNPAKHRVMFRDPN